MYSYSALLPLLFATHYFKFATMIRVHHLNNSRSQRVLWLLEEITTPYEIVRYQRDKKTMLAPKELRRVHPLGKSPVIEDGGRTFVETGLIVEYLVQRFLAWEGEPVEKTADEALGGDGN